MTFINKTKLNIFILYGKAEVLMHSFTSTWDEEPTPNEPSGVISPEYYHTLVIFYVISVVRFLVKSTDINTLKMKGIMAYFGFQFINNGLLFLQGVFRVGPFFLSETNGETVDQNDLSCFLQFLEKCVAVDFLHNETTLLRWVRFSSQYLFIIFSKFVPLPYSF